MSFFCNGCRRLLSQDASYAVNFSYWANDWGHEAKEGWCGGCEIVSDGVMALITKTAGERDTALARAEAAEKALDPLYQEKEIIRGRIKELIEAILEGGVSWAKMKQMTIELEMSLNLD